MVKQPLLYDITYYEITSVIILLDETKDHSNTTCKNSLTQVAYL